MDSPTVVKSSPVKSYTKAGTTMFALGLGIPLLLIVLGGAIVTKTGSPGIVFATLAYITVPIGFIVALVGALRIVTGLMRESKEKEAGNAVS